MNRNKNDWAERYELRQVLISFYRVNAEGEGWKLKRLLVSARCAPGRFEIAHAAMVRQYFGRRDDAASPS